MNSLFQEASQLPFCDSHPRAANPSTTPSARAQPCNSHHSSPQQNQSHERQGEGFVNPCRSHQISSQQPLRSVKRKSLWNLGAAACTHSIIARTKPSTPKRHHIEDPSTIYHPHLPRRAGHPHSGHRTNPITPPLTYFARVFTHSPNPTVHNRSATRIDIPAARSNRPLPSEEGTT